MTVVLSSLVIFVAIVTTFFTRPLSPDASSAQRRAAWKLRRAFYVFLILLDSAFVALIVKTWTGGVWSTISFVAISVAAFYAVRGYHLSVTVLDSMKKQ